MNLRKSIKNLKLHLNKRGSYILEATMSLPVLILCIVAMALIIRIIAVCEGIGFTTAQEVKDIDLKAYSLPAVYPLGKSAIKNSVLDENERLTDFKVTMFKYRYTDNEIQDLIGVQTKSIFSVENPIGINGKITFTQGLLTRAYTGALQDAEPLSVSEFEKDADSVTVVIFPKYGLRFHVPSCYNVTKEYEGNEYRLKMERDDAIAKGYTPCMTCGGGVNSKSS